MRLVRETDRKQVFDLFRMGHRWESDIEYERRLNRRTFGLRLYLTLAKYFFLYISIPCLILSVVVGGVDRLLPQLGIRAYLEENYSRRARVAKERQAKVEARVRKTAAIHARPVPRFQLAAGSAQAIRVVLGSRIVDLPLAGGEPAPVLKLAGPVGQAGCAGPEGPCLALFAGELVAIDPRSGELAPVTLPPKQRVLAKKTFAVTGSPSDRRVYVAGLRGFSWIEADGTWRSGARYPGVKVAAFTPPMANKLAYVLLRGRDGRGVASITKAGDLATQVKGMRRLTPALPIQDEVVQARFVPGLRLAHDPAPVDRVVLLASGAQRRLFLIDPHSGSTRELTRAGE